MTEMGRGVWPDEPPFPDEWSPSASDFDFITAQAYGDDVRDPEELADMRYLPPPEPDDREPERADLEEYLFHIEDVHNQEYWDSGAWFEDEITTSDPEPLPAGIEYADGTGDYPLFEGVQVIEDDNGVRFRTPRRIIRSKDGAAWGLSVFGGLRYFKERDDYGEIRFLANQNGLATGAIWKPHLYPWEDVGEDGLPLIRDRERCRVTVMLENLTESGLDRPSVEIAIRTPSGRYQAQHDVERSYNPQGDQYFNEFVDMQRRQRADIVDYPNAVGERPSILKFIEGLYAEGDYERAHRVSMGEESLPPEFEEYHRPNEWQDRQPYLTTSLASGDIWVPLDLLRSGATEADISFPTLWTRLGRQSRGVATLEELAGQFPPSQEQLEVLDDTMQRLFVPEPRKKFRDQQVGFVVEFGTEDERQKRWVRAKWVAEPTLANGSIDGDKRRTALFIVDDGRIFELWRHERPAYFPIPGSELPFDQQTEPVYEFRAHGEARPTWDDARALFLGAHYALYGNDEDD